MSWRSDDWEVGVFKQLAHRVLVTVMWPHILELESHVAHRRPGPVAGRQEGAVVTAQLHTAW